VAPFAAVFREVGGPSLPDRRAPAPGSDLDAAEAAARVREAVDLLPEQQRLALVLARWQHCSYEEVAEAMGTTVPAVKSLLTRARDHLRERLADLLGPASDEAVPVRARARGEGEDR
jgi:DNA-directed RNA polymerase specialized sigma24 family protein